MPGELAFKHRGLNSFVYPSAFYGAELGGVPKRRLASYKAGAQAAFVAGAKQRRAVEVDLLLHKGARHYHPGLYVTVRTLVFWGRQLIRRPELRDTVGPLWAQEAASRHPKRQAGVVKHVVQTVQQLGWQPTAPDRWRAEPEPGSTQRARDLGPNTSAAFKGAVVRAFKQRAFSDLAKRRADFDGLQAGVDIAATLQYPTELLNYGDRDSYNLCRCILAGGCWTQLRRYSAGLATHGLCACGQEESLAHRWWTCPLRAEERRTRGLGDLVDLHARYGGQPRCFWECGVVPRATWIGLPVSQAKKLAPKLQAWLVVCLWSVLAAEAAAAPEGQQEARQRRAQARQALRLQLSPLAGVGRRRRRRPPEQPAEPAAAAPLQGPPGPAGVVDGQPIEGPAAPFEVGPHRRVVADLSGATRCLDCQRTRAAGVHRSRWLETPCSRERWTFPRSGWTGETAGLPPGANPHWLRSAGGITECLRCGRREATRYRALLGAVCASQAPFEPPAG